MRQGLRTKGPESRSQENEGVFVGMHLVAAKYHVNSMAGQGESQTCWRLDRRKILRRLLGRDFFSEASSRKVSFWDSYCVRLISNTDPDNTAVKSKGFITVSLYNACNRLHDASKKYQADWRMINSTGTDVCITAPVARY